MKKVGRLFRRKKKEENVETTEEPQEEDDQGTSYEDELMADLREEEEETEDSKMERLFRYQQYSAYSADDLKDSLKQVLNETETEYRVEGFSYVEVLVHSLKNGTEQNDLNRLRERKVQLDDAVQQIVSVNYRGLNKTIRNFSDMLELMEKGKKQVGEMMTKVKTAKELLSLRSHDLVSLYSSYLQQKEVCIQHSFSC